MPTAPMTRATLFRVYLGLLLLLALTAGISRFPAGSLPLSLTFAGGKLALISAFFMRLKGARRMVWIFAAAGLFWLGILGALAFSDYLTRS